jgi:uncharacterized protein (TIGR03503 family)
MHRLAWLLIALSLALTAAAGAAEPPRRDEVRVLIDVSGSMKRNDPQNLRAPALRLLVNLLPAQAEAGAWSFAQHVNPLVPVAAVSGDWRRDALAASDSIHSRGLFTDIGAALTTATRDWQEPNPASRRSLILLTDGVVDVSKDPGANERARAAILNKLLPRLKSAGIQLHTIALSANADAELLTSLAEGTDGGFAQTESADELQRIFLKMFERAVSRDTLPLENNRFQVDASVDELTLLVFSKPDAPAAQLQPPGTTPFGAGNAPANARWHTESGYDLITIERPSPGEWQILAEVDPGNRAMIVSDLKLRVSEIPNNLLPGEAVPLQIALTENDAVITRPDFLRLLEVGVQQQSGSDARRWALADNGLADDGTGGDGIYSMRLGPSLRAGDNELLIEVKSDTFQRQLRQIVRLAGQPFAVQVEPRTSGHRLLIEKRVDWIKPESVRIGASVSRSDGSSAQLTVPAEGTGWALTLLGVDGQLEQTVELQAAGKTESGRQFQLSLPPVRLAPPAPAAPPAEVAPSEPTPQPEAPAANWLMIGAAVVFANLVLAALGGLVWYLVKRRRRPPPGFGEGANAIAAVAAATAVGASDAVETDAAPQRPAAVPQLEAEPEESVALEADQDLAEDAKRPETT